MNAPSYQIEVRCRVRGQTGKALHDLPRQTRSLAVASLLAAAGEGLDWNALIANREHVQRLGVLLNQALRLARLTKTIDSHFLGKIRQAVELIEAITQTP